MRDTVMLNLNNTTLLLKRTRLGFWMLIGKPEVVFLEAELKN